MTIYDLVYRDIEIRKQVGIQRYGGPLTIEGPTCGDGEATLVEAYKEALDLVIYLRREIARRGLMPSH